jgi:hypothetical protein
MNWGSVLEGKDVSLIRALVTSPPKNSMPVRPLADLQRSEMITGISITKHPKVYFLLDQLDFDIYGTGTLNTAVKSSAALDE